MKISYIRLRFSIFLISISFISCKKSNDNSGEFTWTYNGTLYSASFTYASFIEDLGHNIIGNMGNGLTNGTGVSFTVHPLQTGVYAIGPGGNYGGFVDPEGYDLPTVGILNITSISGNKLNGNFMLTVGPTGNQYDVSGTISNIPIED